MLTKCFFKSEFASGLKVLFEKILQFPIPTLFFAFSHPFTMITKPIEVFAGKLPKKTLSPGARLPPDPALEALAKMIFISAFAGAAVNGALVG